MTYSSDDKSEARQAFDGILESWDYTVWGNRQDFETAKAWAAKQ
jgi:hypothetical protein